MPQRAGDADIYPLNPYLVSINLVCNGRPVLAETYYHRCPAPKKFGTSPARSFFSQRFSHTVPIRQKARHCSKYVSVSSNFPCLAKALVSCMDGPNELSWGEPGDWPALYN